MALLSVAPVLGQEDFQPPPIGPVVERVPTDEGVQRMFSDRDPFHRRLAELLGLRYPCTVETKHLGQFFNITRKLTLDDGSRRESVVVKPFSHWVAYKWYMQKIMLPSVPMSVHPGKRFLNEQKMNERFRGLGLKTLDIVLADAESHVIVTRFLKGNGMEKVLPLALDHDAGALGSVEQLGLALAMAHRNGFCVGDLKPDNVMVLDGELYFIDLDQAAASGDKSWDIAEFFYYAIFLNRFSGQPESWSLAARSFLRGYLAGGGDRGSIQRALSPRYLLPFSSTVAPKTLGALRAVRKELRRAASGMEPLEGE